MSVGSPYTSELKILNLEIGPNLFCYRSMHGQHFLISSAVATSFEVTDATYSWVRKEHVQALAPFINGL